MTELDGAGAAYAPNRSVEVSGDTFAYRRFGTAASAVADIGWDASGFIDGLRFESIDMLGFQHVRHFLGR